jgi:putative membrane-bound dehydrogenase-like protein
MESVMSSQIALRCFLAAFALMAGAVVDEPPLPNTQKGVAGPPSPQEAARALRLPPGFRATLFAGEPDVRQPIAFEIDDRGRLWVAECYSYPEWKPEGHDRIVILEDENGDGHFDRRKIFWEGGRHLTGLALGFGGAWICNAPEVQFIADSDHDDVPDGPPVSVLDGWSTEAKHNVVNGMAWGPDGWLYGRHGGHAASHVGLAGDSQAPRTPLKSCIWRYHPTRKVFEVVAHGGTNPWGLDWDEYGEGFFTNNVNGHFWHLIPGAHYTRFHGQYFHPFAYDYIKLHADHLHHAGADWGAWEASPDTSIHDQMGGGHSHCGGMIYLGDNWPASYRGKMFTCNTHGHRVNCDRIESSGSGYIARHEVDFLSAANPWYRGIELKYGPDGGVYLSDWTDEGECHDDDGVHRSSGRIYKITYDKVNVSTPINLTAESDQALVELQLHQNDWYVRHARLILRERAAAGQKIEAAAVARLKTIFAGDRDLRRRLRALWALEAVAQFAEADRLTLLMSPEPMMRAWGVRLLGDQEDRSGAVVSALEALGETEMDAHVRLWLASVLQRLPVENRLHLAEALGERKEDSADHNLPLMIWYGIEPLVAADSASAVDLLQKCEIPIVRRYIARRLAENLEDNVIGERLVGFLGTSTVAARVEDALQGIIEGTAGRNGLKPPKGWDQAYGKLEKSDSRSVRELARLVGLRLGDRNVRNELVQVMGSVDEPLETRRNALIALADQQVPGMSGPILKLLNEPELRLSALKALSSYDDDHVPAELLRWFPDLKSSEKQAAVTTLASRPSYAKPLLDAIRSGLLTRSEVSSVVARQLRSLNDPDITSAIENLWGAVRETPRERQGRIARYRTTLSTPGYLDGANLESGKAQFDRVCANCHRLLGQGGEIGPDLTGSDRRNLDYVLENVLDPGAVVSQDFRATVIAMDDGRVFTGVVRERGNRSIVLQTANERVVIYRNHIEEERPTSESLMPDGLLNDFSDEQVRDLVAYLRGAANSSTGAAADSAPR